MYTLLHYLSILLIAATGAMGSIVIVEFIDRGVERGLRFLNNEPVAAALLCLFITFVPALLMAIKFSKSRMKRDSTVLDDSNEFFEDDDVSLNIVSPKWMSIMTLLYVISTCFFMLIFYDEVLSKSRHWNSADEVLGFSAFILAWLLIVYKCLSLLIKNRQNKKWISSQQSLET